MRAPALRHIRAFAIRNGRAARNRKAPAMATGANRIRRA